MQITPTKLTVAGLMGTANEQYVIPAYQRRYSWREPQIADLFDDIRNLEGNDTHLLGSIVCLTGVYRAGLNHLEVVDGQQRLTTITILMHCLRERLAEEGETPLADNFERMLCASDASGTKDRKVALDSLDADEYVRLVRNELDGVFKNANLVTAFSLLREWVSELSLDEVRAFSFQLQNQAVIIRLDVNQAKDAFKLFETINNRGLRLSPTDIIKNFLLGNAARFGESKLSLARTYWGKLIADLDGVSTDVFFRNYLSARLKRRVTQSYVVPSFKELFMAEVSEAVALPERHRYVETDESEDEEAIGPEEATGIAPETKRESAGIPQVDFEAFVKQLVRSAKIYGDLVLCRTGIAKIDRRLRNLRMIKATQTYGFLTFLRAGGCNDKDFLEILRLTESLMLRRHVCRERANENESLFGGLCEVDPKSALEAVRSKYAHACPSDEKFRLAFASAQYPSRLIDRARYCLEQFELDRHGKHEELNVLGPELVHVEHIIPQKIKTKQAKVEFGNWVEYLGAHSVDRHDDYVGRIGNLTLFSGELNIVASNNPFARKRPSYKKSSLLLTKEIGAMSNFRFDQVEKRSKAFAALAVELWPIP